MLVKIVGLTKNDYHKTLATMSEQQVHSFMRPIRDDLTASECSASPGAVSAIVIDPKDFPEMDRFIVFIPFAG